MSLAYLILAHKQPEQVARLVAHLDPTGNLVSVHVDQKVDVGPFARALADVEASQTLVEDRVRCDWARMGHVLATLSGMRAALESDRPFTHLVLLTGQDYPIKPVSHIETFFAGQPERSFISWSLGDGDTFTAEDRLDGRWRWNGNLRRITGRYVHVRGRAIGLPNRYVPWFPAKRLPAGMTPAQGLAYWNLSREAVAAVIDLLDARPDILRFFATSLMADENVFQMVLPMLSLGGDVVNDDLRYLEWQGFHPRLLTVEDLPKLVRSPKLFARKFDSRADAAVLDALDTEVLAG